jgi:hypothetical protein
MEGGAKVEPWRIFNLAHRADFRVPSVGQSFAIRALRLALSGAVNSGVLTLYSRGNQWKRFADDERITRQRCRFPLAADS